VDRYALFDVIAVGGMAAVHLGRLMGPVGFTRTVAIKRLHENFARDPEFVAMFLDEARLVARIRHPNVVQTLDVVAAAQELLLVMEYVLGESLAQLIKTAHDKKRLIPIPIVVDIISSVLNGLHAAHEATNEKGEPLNVVHRDVSPQNILVGADGVTRVLDFGIAQAIGYMPQTRPGQLKGKIRYMPPEQFSGQDVGRAADVYAASVVLWEALACNRLFGRGSDEEAVRKALEGKIPAPSELRPDIPRELDEIVLRGLRRDPAERYASAKAMADALEAVAAPVTRRTVSTWVLESAGSEIQRRQECLTRVESSVTPAAASRAPDAPPNDALDADSKSSSSVGALAQSVRPDQVAATRRPQRKQLLVLAAAVSVLGLAALTSTLFGGSSADNHPQKSTREQVATPPAPQSVAAAQTAAPPSAPAPSPPVPALAPADSAASTASKSAPPTTTAKRTRAKQGSFDRIYKRD
jgi:serine/threonine-protein kinase